MTSAELYSLMLRCNGAQLTAITTKLELNPAYLPDAAQPIATRATEILNLAQQRELLPKLEEALLELFPRQPMQAGSTASKARRLLIVAANPIETDRLRIDEEVRLIKERLNESEPGRNYKVEAEWAVRATDLSKFLMQHEPVIVHFSGHGNPTGDIVLEDEFGRARPLAANRLANLFEILKGSTECIVLNACYSLETAKILANYVGCVVGMEKSIGDPSALRFAAGFYRGIAFGRDYHLAFRLGCNEIDLAALPDASIPHFTTREEDRVGQRTLEAGIPATNLAVPTRSWVTRGTAEATLEPDDPDSPRLYPIWFGTDRRPNDTADLTKGFSNERAPDESAVYVGTCTVAIPKSHRFGSVGSNWWKRFVLWTDDRLAVTEISPLGFDAFWASARQAIEQVESNERMALVFIHGFRVTFKEAAIRAAQIGFDLKIPGITAFFSWPSKGRLSLFDYNADEATIEASAGKISNFLVDFAGRTDARRIQVIAHSMGNRGLLSAMQRIVAEAADAAKKPFHHVVFAAPDVDAAVFRDLAKHHPSVAEHATMYVSAQDRAVASSGLIHDAPRAGFVPPVTLVDGIDTIEVSNVDLTLLGHGYYGAAAGVLYDMRELLVHDTLPKSRTRLSDTKRGYWQINE
jgi:esterase/lipase superfamily enzyme